MSYKLKKIVITGGSRGLGRALAIAFDKLGHQVVIVGRQSKALRSVCEEGRQIRFFEADVSRKEDIYKISGAIGGIIGKPDIVIQCASYLGQTPLRPLADTNCEDLEKVLDTNLIGPFRLTKALLGAMTSRNGGIFVNLSSDAAVMNYENWGGYSLSKAALDKMSGIFDEECRVIGIRHLAVDPGDMATDMHFAALPDADPKQLYRPEDVARDLVAFLLQGHFPKSRYSASQWRQGIL